MVLNRSPLAQAMRSVKRVGPPPTPPLKTANLDTPVLPLSREPYRDKRQDRGGRAPAISTRPRLGADNNAGHVLHPVSGHTRDTVTRLSRDTTQV